MACFILTWHHHLLAKLRSFLPDRNTFHVYSQHPSSVHGRDCIEDAISKETPAHVSPPKMNNCVAHTGACRRQSPLCTWRLITRSPHTRSGMLHKYYSCDSAFVQLFNTSALSVQDPHKVSGMMHCRKVVGKHCALRPQSRVSSNLLALWLLERRCSENACQEGILPGFLRPPPAATDFVTT